MLGVTLRAWAWTPDSWPSWQYSREGAAQAVDVWSGLVERAYASGFSVSNLTMGTPTSNPSLYRSQYDNLVAAKRDVGLLIPRFLDVNQNTNGSFNGWFAGTNDAPPYWTTNTILRYLRIPTNYLEWTPYRMLSCCGDATNDPTVGHPAGWEVGDLPALVLAFTAAGFTQNYDVGYGQADGEYWIDWSLTGAGVYWYTNTVSAWNVMNVYGTWDFNVSDIGPFFSMTDSGIYGGPTGDTWYVYDASATAGVTMALSFQAAGNEGGMQFPGGRTNWYSTDYGWCYMSNLFSAMVFTPALSNGYGASTCFVGYAFGYEAPDTEVGGIDVVTYLDTADFEHFQFQSWGSADPWGLTNAGAGYALGAWQISGKISTTNPSVSYDMYGVASVNYSLSNTRGSWPHIMGLEITGEANNPAVGGDIGDAVYCLWIGDDSPAQVLSQGYLYDDCSGNGRDVYAEETFNTGTSSNSIQTSMRWVVVRTATSITFPGVEQDSTPPDPTPVCTAFYPTPTDPVLTASNDYQYIAKVASGKELKSYSSADLVGLTHDSQFYVKGAFPSGAGTNDAAWDPQGYDVATNRYRMVAGVTGAGSSATWSGMYTNTGIPFMGAYDTFRGWSVDALWSVDYWGGAGGFRYK